jgi:hypothetical protein
MKIIENIVITIQGDILFKDWSDGIFVGSVVTGTGIIVGVLSVTKMKYKTCNYNI